MSSQKRGGFSNHYGDRSQNFNKRQRPNQPSYNSATYHDGNRNASGKPQQRGNAVLPQHERAASIQPVLSGVEMQTGVIALLDRFVAAETTPEADKDVLHHACKLRRLLSERNEKSASAQAKRELDDKRPDKAANVIVPDYIHRKVEAAKDFPPLPPIAEPHLHEAVFTHQSVHVTNANVHQGVDLGLDYERLEFLGDAYIELIASRALYNRFPQVDVPQLCSWRERLVENLALGKFSEGYGFPDRLKHKFQWDKDSKAWRKVVADIFEAYVAALILSDPENGFGIAEEWLDELWAPQLLGFKEKIIENPRARDDLQKLCFVTHIDLKYREEKLMVHENGVQRFFLGVYLTGWGYENAWLGSGEGQNKAQACISAATDALKRNNAVLRDATRQKKALMEVRAKERAEKAKAETAENGQGEEHTMNTQKIPASLVPRNADANAEDPNLESATKKRKGDSVEASPEKSKKHKKHNKEKEKTRKV